MGHGLPIVNFTRNGTVLGQARATTLNGKTYLTVPFPTSSTSLVGPVSGLNAGTVGVEVYNQTGPATISLPESIILTVNSPSAILTVIPTIVTPSTSITASWSRRANLFRN